MPAHGLSRPLDGVVGAQPKGFLGAGDGDEEVLPRRRAHVRLVADRLGLTPTQVVALRELTDPITARELAGRMSCEPSNVTFVLDRLEQQGLVQRRPHPTDRRAKQIVLTADGRKRRTEVLRQLRTRSPLDPLTADQRQSLRALLQALVAPQVPG